MTEDITPPAGPLPGAGYASSFPAPGLRQIFRHITGHNDEGKSVFLSSDHGDHHRVMGEQQAVANILYSTRETPVELNDNADIEKAKSEEVRTILIRVGLVKNQYSNEEG